MKNLDTGVRKVAEALYCHLNTPKSLAAFIALKHKEWAVLASLRADPAHYLEGCIGAEKFRRDAQACDLLRKSPLLPLDVDRKKKARETFHECERQCLESNLYLDFLAYPSASEDAGTGRLRDILLGARKIAKRILGKIPDDLFGRFGPGTSFEMKGQAYSTLADKMWITPHATRDCMAIFEHMFWPTLWGRTRLERGLPLPAIARGNRFTTVPKEATKDRGICVEPLGNLYCQLAVGGHWKRRLAKVGIRVDRSKPITHPLQPLQANPPLTGKELHNRLACYGSMTGDWVTIDLSNASDTMCKRLVEWVIPSDWYELLCAIRSPLTLIDGTWVHLEKFSSMGNGATFELETTVFLAILASVTGLKPGRDLYVYGDDIILPARKSRDALAVLRAVGLTPNLGKTFTSGPFRESCGGDFFSGYNVRSYYADKDFSSPLQWIACHNELRRRWGVTLASKRCIEQVPTKFRVFGPPSLGDRVFHGTPLRTWNEDGCVWVATLAVQPTIIPLDRWGSEFTLSLALLGCQSRGITPRDAIDGYRLCRASIS